MTDASNAPRCTDCDHVLPGFGAVCHVCDVETHFEGVTRTAPPLFSRASPEAQPQPADLRAS